MTRLLGVNVLMFSVDYAKAKIPKITMSETEGYEFKNGLTDAQLIIAVLLNGSDELLLAPAAHSKFLSVLSSLNPTKAREVKEKKNRFGEDKDTFDTSNKMKKDMPPSFGDIETITGLEDSENDDEEIADSTN
jgi:hypothetical protein